MANQVSGQLYKVFEKDWKGKTLRSLKLDGNPIYYRWGEKPLPAGVVAGANVSFTAEDNADGKSANIKGDVTVSKATAAQDSQKAAAGTGAVNWAAKDDSIRYQSSRKDALAFLALPGVLENVVGKAKPADKLGIIEATLDRYTAAFFEDVATFGAVTRANATETEPTPGADEEEEE